MLVSLGEELGVVHGVAAGRIDDDDDLLEAGQVVHDLVDLGPDAITCGEEDLGATVGEDVLPILLGLCLVHGHPRRPEPVGGIGADGPLDAVV